MASPAMREYDLPNVLRGLCTVAAGDVVLPPDPQAARAVKERFPRLYGAPRLDFRRNVGGAGLEVGRQLLVGVVFGGAPAPGAVECVAGLFAALKRWNANSRLIGFRMGLKGLLECNYVEIDKALLDRMVNDVGMILGTGRLLFDEVKLATAMGVIEGLSLDGVVTFGGKHTTAAAAWLAEESLRRKLHLSVICASKRAEGCSSVEPCLPNISYGYDTTVKHYSWLVGNIAADVASARSAYHFVRLMGKENDFAVLETALAVHPNVVLVGEELRRSAVPLAGLVASIADVVCARAQHRRDYGVVLLPEDVLSNIVEVRALLDEASDVVDKHAIDAAYRSVGEYNKMTNVRSDALSPSELLAKLSPAARALGERLPAWFLAQVVGSRNAFGEVAMEAVQVERFFAVLVSDELERRKAEGRYVGKFAAQTHFYGYETRSQTPSVFDGRLGNALGHSIRALIEARRTGYLVQMHDLHKPVAEWRPVATPVTASLEFRRGRAQARNAAAGSDCYLARAVAMLRAEWSTTDRYRFPVGTLSDELPGLVQLAALERRHCEDRLMSGDAQTKELLDCVRQLSLEHSTFMQQRLEYQPRVPDVLRGGFRLQPVNTAALHLPTPSAALNKHFPVLSKQGGHAVRVAAHEGHERVDVGKPLRVGVVLSGGPAPGGHNVISGLYDFLARRNASSRLLGFVNGPDGLLRGECVNVTEEGVGAFRNQGGFNYLGTSRTKIETQAQFFAAAGTVAKLRLDALVICGGDDSNTNAAILADYFLQNGTGCRVVGVPKTIDADLRTDQALEMSFGFDTASKVYANLLANICGDARANGQRWHFARVMGRSASHLALEVALQAHPNVAIISEEVAARSTSLLDLVQDIKNLVLARHEDGKDYGVVLVPEGLIEVVKDLKHLIAELNEIMAGADGAPSAQDCALLHTKLTEESRQVFAILPDWLRTQLLSERDPHGNVRVSLIESERLLASLVAQELAAADVAAHHPTLEFKYWCHFLGYQGRCSLPSNFDADYCYVLGHLAGALSEGGATGVICGVRHLDRPVAKWDLLGLPLTSLMSLERRKGRDKPVIEKHLVALSGRPFAAFAAKREAWRYRDGYPRRADWARYSTALDDSTSATLALEAQARRQKAALRTKL
eukprot:TRINITY_DN6439_c1_g3_i1.p1 TRINITY_DN6439_c1_g3~~TRINITY_DN6439_c1_g3_i1.p1  ORF type:complete len:1138 (+),score=378.31 TRINITY_DN6439_c1_g3_i1:81-3494(+)